MTLCIYFLEHGLFQEKIRLGSLVMSYFCPASGPKICIFSHKFA